MVRYPCPDLFHLVCTKRNGEKVTPAEEVFQAARRGLQLLQGVAAKSNAYERSTISDLKVFYTNLYHVANRTRELEIELESRITFNGVEDFPTPTQIFTYESELQTILHPPTDDGNVRITNSVNGIEAVPESVGVGTTPRLVLSIKRSS